MCTKGGGGEGGGGFCGLGWGVGFDVDAVTERVPGPNTTGGSLEEDSWSSEGIESLGVVTQCQCFRHARGNSTAKIEKDPQVT